MLIGFHATIKHLEIEQWFCGHYRVILYGLSHLFLMLIDREPAMSISEGIDNEGDEEVFEEFIKICHYLTSLAFLYKYRSRMY